MNMFALATCVIAALLTTQAAPPAEPAKPAQPPAAPVQGDLFVRVTVKDRGTFTIQLCPAEAPQLCAHFCMLLRRNYYNGQPFNGWTRVIRQASGPIGLASPGYTLRREFSSKLLFDGPGKVAMQRMTEGDGVHPTNFFVTTKEQDRWNLELPIFAVVTTGQSVVDAIAEGNIIERMELQGDSAPLMARFEAKVAQWSAALDAALKAGQGAKAPVQ